MKQKTGHINSYIRIFMDHSIEMDLLLVPFCSGDRKPQMKQLKEKTST